MVLVVVVDCDLLFWVCGRSRWVYGFGYGFGSLFFFLGLWQTQKVCGGLLFWVFGGDCGCFGWWCG